jgi:hypothetical protein
MPDEGLFVVDTSDLFAALEGAATVDRRSLGRVCNLLQLPTEYLHNAGNDAYVGCRCMIFGNETYRFVLVHPSGNDVDGKRRSR